MGNVKLMFDPANPKSVSKTKQSFKNEVNINKIMAKAVRGGLVPATNKQALFGDFTSAVDFKTAQDRLINARVAFEKLPSALRNKFANNPANLIEFLNNEANRDEAVKLGLIEAKKPSAEELAAQKTAMDTERKTKLKDDLKALGVTVP